MPERRFRHMRLVDTPMFVIEDGSGAISFEVINISVETGIIPTIRRTSVGMYLSDVIERTGNDRAKQLLTRLQQRDDWNDWEERIERDHTA